MYVFVIIVPSYLFYVLMYNYASRLSNDIISFPHPQATISTMVLSDHYFGMWVNERHDNMVKLPRLTSTLFT